MASYRRCGVRAPARSGVARTGQPVRSARFMATRVVAIVEHPADTVAADDERPRPPRRGGPPENQAALEL